MSGTRRTLVRLRAALLAATALALAGCLAVFLGVARTADAAADRSVPAVLAVYDAQNALLRAHAAAVRNLTVGGVVLGGPGVEYQRQIAGAGQYLTLVAENNAAGDDGTRDIQTVEALLVTYTGLIEQADARYREADLHTLGAVALRDAASLLNDIMGLLDTLRGKQLAVLDQQVDTGWSDPVTALAWLVPLVVLGVLLVLAQGYLSRRFRRTWNLPLLLATVATVGLVLLTSLSLRSAGQLDQVRGDLQAVHDGRQVQLDEVRADAAIRLADAVRAECESACATVLAAIEQDARNAPGPPPDPDAAAQAETEAEARTVARAGRAADSRQVEYVLPVLALGIVVLVLTGFQPRLAEYGYRAS
ncbi:hypothetical protein [Micromonospora schwarzwaldensis]|uniref:hypothetical protein n=1 Tax=Micromonospora sp. DSM 45708 TaxID=3111767 RepID=UPI0031E284D4